MRFGEISSSDLNNIKSFTGNINDHWLPEMPWGKIIHDGVQNFAADGHACLIALTVMSYIYGGPVRKVSSGSIVASVEPQLVCCWRWNVRVTLWGVHTILLMTHSNVYFWKQIFIILIHIALTLYPRGHIYQVRISSGKSVPPDKYKSS